MLSIYISLMGYKEMMNKKSLIIALIGLLLPLLSFAQIDTFNLILTEHSKELKNKIDQSIFEKNFIDSILNFNREFILKCENVFFFEYLLRLDKIELNRSIDKNYSVFTQGCKCGNNYIVNKGIQTKNLNRYSNNRTSLMFAVESQDLGIINLLASNLNNINAIDDQGESCLLKSVENNDNVDILRILDKYKIDFKYKNINKWNYSAIELAFYHRHFKVTDYLLERHILDKDTLFLKNSDLMNIAISNLDISYVKKLLPFYAISKVDSNFFNVLVLSLEGYSYCSKFREQHNSIDTTCVLYSSKDLDIELLKILIHNGLNINELNKSKQNILFLCKNIEPIVKFLVLQKININQLDSNNKTVLEYYIDEIIEPKTFNLNGLNISDKEQNRNYNKELKLLDFYIRNGAIVGREKRNGWYYIYEKALEKKNKYLSSWLLKKYKNKIR
jgi:hypothetical protein